MSSVPQESDISDSVYSAEVPSVTGLNVDFVYNYYVKDERINPDSSPAGTDLSRISRYVSISWNTPKGYTYTVTDANKRLADASSSPGIFSQDDLTQIGYLPRTFSDVSHVLQSSNDLETTASEIGTIGSSLSDLSKLVLQEYSNNFSSLSTDPKVEADQKAQIDAIRRAHSYLFNLPYSNLGLQFLDADGKQISTSSDSSILSVAADDLSINMKIKSDVFTDFFRTTPSLSDAQSVKFLNSVKNNKSDRLSVPAEASTPQASDTIVGYIVDKFRVTSSALVRLKTFYIEGPQTSSMIDKDALYGTSYLYSVRSVARITAYLDGDANPSTLYVSSHPVSKSVECFEYSPPPPPDTLNFNYDYERNNLRISWNTPTYKQRDIKQYQVFRRDSIMHPFELVAQYGFDDSITGVDGKRYLSGEKTDSNDMKAVVDLGLSDLVKYDPSGREVSYHIDEDFSIDTQFYQNEPDFIYAVGAVDAHGMVSNYSAQYRVTFDPYKNRPVIQHVASSGSPRQYPNLTLEKNIFKDASYVEDENSGQTKKMTLYLSPDCLSIEDSKNNVINTIKTKTQTADNNKSYYVYQLINLDNQKVQQVKIEVSP